MFEQQRWADLDPASGEPLWLLDEPERSEEDYLAEVEWLIAQDPLTRPAPTPAEVIARGESEAMNPGLIALLEAIDVSALDEDLRVGLSVAWDRAANYCHAQRGLAVAGVVRRVTGWGGGAAGVARRRAAGRGARVGPWQRGHVGDRLDAVRRPAARGP